MTKRELIERLELLRIGDDAPILFELRLNAQHDFEILCITDLQSKAVITLAT